MKRRFSILAICLVACHFNPTQAQTDVKNSREILLEMLRTYENAKSYEDVGELRLIPQDSTPSNPQPLLPKVQLPSTSITFRTYFTRPQLFRFEWSQYDVPKPQRISIIWSNGTENYSWQANPALKSGRFVFSKRDSLSALVRDSLKPSGGMVATIPSLLVNELLPYTFANLVADLTDVSLTKEEVVDKELCFVISGKVEETPWLFWVGRDSHLLRKIRSFYSIGSFHDRSNRSQFVAEEIHRHIKINHRIPVSTFRYKPRVRIGDLDLTR